MDLVFSFFYFLSLYVAPGFFVSRIFGGKARNNLFVWALLSYILVPFIYIGLSTYKLLSPVAFLIILTALGGICALVGRKRVGLNLDFLFKERLEAGNKILKYASLGCLIFFFSLLMTPRFGLLVGNVPVGDDKPRVGQVTSIALSPDLPLHFRLPTTKMSIYYYHMVQPGLLSKFSNYLVRPNVSWFIHLSMTYLLFLWFINLISNYFSRNNLQKFITVFAMTFYGGLEYYLSFVRPLNTELGHLEWWTDWFIPDQRIHMQISSPFTSSFWVTQHVLPSFLVFIFYLVLTEEKINKWIKAGVIGLLGSAILGNSVFVFLALALSLVGYLVIRILQRKENFWELLGPNLLSLVIFLLLSSGLISLLLESGKENYFILHSNMFTFLPNIGLGKIVNYLATFILYFAVELNWLFLVLIYSVFLFFRKKQYQEKTLFLYLLLVPFVLIFFFRAKGDDNFSMRSTLPGLAFLAVLTGSVVSDLYHKFRSKLFYLVLAGALLALTPSIFWEWYWKVADQFNKVDPIFKMIDQNTPTQSIVFVEVVDKEKITQDIKNSYNYITEIAHRFTLKPVFLFDITDTEYTSSLAKTEYGTKFFSDLGEVIEISSEDPVLKDFSKYYLTTRHFETLKLAFASENYKVYKID